MSEYTRVEEPFLNKLEELGWKVINQGSFGIPSNPEESLRSTFKEVTLKGVFKEAVRNINLTDDNKPWLSDKQLEDIYDTVTETERGHLSLLESNKKVFERLTGLIKTTVQENKVTGEQNPLVKVIDFENWQNNTFTAINQFRIVTPGGPRHGIIPDIVLFVNGLPFVVVECKDVEVTEPLSEAFDQIKRYSNSRDADFGIKEGEEKLFHYNLLSIATHGEEARFGSISGEFEHFLNWKDIFPENYKTIELCKYSPEEQSRYRPDKFHKQCESRQEVMINGMLNKEIMLDVLRHFTLFMEIKKGVEIKVICRYQQYRAVGKIIERMRKGQTPDERSGVVWHTQGSGKSLTMVFLIRKMRSLNDLKDYKVIMMVDRKDLEKQLGETAILTGEFREYNIIGSRRELQPKLGTSNSDLHLVMVHKLMHEELKQSKALMKAFVEDGKVPKFEAFPEVNSSNRILILIDEAHRSQGGDMGDNLFSAFPNAGKVAFTGTPLMTERHKRKTYERFGDNPDFIDTYKVRESVRDRATLDIVYIGKTSNDYNKDSKAFKREFEDFFKERSQAERLEIQKRYGTMDAYLSNKDRIKKIASDLVNHYVDDILPNGLKAMVVASSILAAARYEFYIKEAIAERLQMENNKTNPDLDLINRIEILEACTVVTQVDNNEDAVISAVRQKAKEMDAVESFKKDFDFSKDETGNFKNPRSGVAFLCVCDRLLTGFDAPIAQVMYLDKNLKEHNLMQAIARVNRTKSQKEHGILVDYYGVTNNLREAFNIFAAEEDENNLKEFLEYFRDVDSEIPVLEARYNRMLQLFEDKGIKDFRGFAEQSMTDTEEEFQLAEQCIELAESIPFRAQFDTYVQAFFDSLDLLYNTSVAKDYYIPAKRFGYLLVRIRNRYKDQTLDLKYAKGKVRKLIDEYLLSMGIDSTIPPVSLLSEDFSKELEKVAKNHKSKASEMEHAIRRHLRIDIKPKDPGLYRFFDERITKILEAYKENWARIVEELGKLTDDIKEGRAKICEPGLDKQQVPFYDLILLSIYDNVSPAEQEKAQIKAIVSEIVDLLQEALNLPNFWKTRENEIKMLRGKIDDILYFKAPEIIAEQHDKLCVEIMALAKNRHYELTQSLEL